MQDAKEEVRARLAIEDVVGEYVQLKRAGRNFKGLSPFTSERTPSFVVSPEKNIWHDFSSGRGGDIFSFVMEVEGLDFREALDQLARKAGVDLSQYDSKRSAEASQKKKRYQEANELAAKYFQQSLLKNQHALEYVFKKRGLSKQIVQDFRIGYAPDSSSALIEILQKKGFSNQELSGAGLTNRYGGDIFRARMTVPLMDGSGQVIGFTGRIIVDDPKAPKYLNTPQTLLYDKSRHVFGLSQAKEAIRKMDEAVIVEGNLDVVSSHQAGVNNVVASAGTAMTEYHLKTLSRLTGNIKIAFDGDAAGIAATERSIILAQNVGVELSVVSVPPPAKDPDELIQQDVELWRKAIAEAEPVVDWILHQYSLREDMSTAAGKRRFTTAALVAVKVLNDSVEREHYFKKIAEMTDTSLEAVQSKFSQQGVEKAVPKKVIKTTSDGESNAPNFNTYQDNLLAILLGSISARALLAETNTNFFHGKERQKLAEFLKSFGDVFEGVPPELQEIETYVKIVELKAETRYGTWNDADTQQEAARLLRQMEVEHKKLETEKLLEELRDAESGGDDKTAARLRTQLSKLIKETARG
ncbi:MAG TPA: DNA primase [Candidatus Saccharimonadales bacterium]